MYQVTYWNAVLKKRCVLIDGVDETTADSVVERFGPSGDTFHKLPEVRKEKQA